MVKVPTVKPSLDKSLIFHPIPIWDPAPEIFRILEELPIAQRVGVIDVINQQRVKMDAARAAGNAEITKAVTAAAAKIGK